MQDRRTAFTTDAPVALDPATQSLVAGGLKEQTKPVLNLGQVLAAAGSPLERVLETTVCCVPALKAK